MDSYSEIFKKHRSKWKEINSPLKCLWLSPYIGLPWWLTDKESTCQCKRHKDLGSIPESEWSPGEGNGSPTPVFLPGKFHGQRSLAGYSPWGHKELHTTQQQQSANEPPGGFLFVYSPFSPSFCLWSSLLPLLSLLILLLFVLLFTLSVPSSPLLVWPLGVTTVLYGSLNRSFYNAYHTEH